MSSQFLSSSHGSTLLQLWLLALLLALPAHATPSPLPPVSAAPVDDYDRLLPLEGASNFRDAGGYFTADGRRVRRGLLFRSAVMTSLTERDREYLQAFGFQRVVDLRSREERELYPNHWAAERGIEVVAHDYSMRALMQRMSREEESAPAAGAMHELYRGLPYFLEPQLRLLFDELLQGNVPLAVNCSAGQDRTGVSVALLLLALGVPRDVVVQDYLQSTRYRRPAVERGDVDLEKAAQRNAFAALMLRYRSGGEAAAATPLLTEQGVPFLRFAIDRVEQDFGSVQAFLRQRIGVDAEDVARLRALYLERTFDAAAES